jgi:spore maturation protein CgeB
MVRAGWSPSVRLFEAAACATPIVSDSWPGLGHIFSIGREILVGDVAGALALDPDELREIGARARARVLAEHTAEHRAAELEAHVREAQPVRA